MRTLSGLGLPDLWDSICKRKSVPSGEPCSPNATLLTRPERDLKVSQDLVSQRHKAVVAKLRTWTACDTLTGLENPEIFEQYSSFETETGGGPRSASP